MMDIGEKMEERDGKERGRIEGMRKLRKGLKEDSYTLQCFTM